MRTIRIIALLTGIIFLTTSCYTQLAFVERNNSYANEEDYYYPPADTLYTDEAPTIVQNYYYGSPYDYSFRFNVGWYDNWWWNDFYTGWPYYGYYRPLRPFLLYPFIGYMAYDPFFYDYYYYDYWWGGAGPVYSTPYGPKPFVKNGTMIRGSGSKRVRISKTPGIAGSGSSSFLPTRTSGSSVTGTSKTARKRISEVVQNDRKPVRTVIDGSQTKTVIRKGKSATKRTKVIRKTSSRGKKYFPITRSKNTQPKRIVRQTKPKAQSKIVRSKNTKKTRSWAPTRSSRSGYSPSYSSPPRSSSSGRSTSIRSSSSSRSSSHSSGRSSSRSSGSRSAVKRR
ncbi:MAG: hypothetical protein GXO77_14290 [Calditrichaeota bacterium]|nr:hypothetical protein [Calditrichota bacterium]